MSTPNTPTKNTNAWSTKQLVTMALMCAIGVLLSFIEFPLLPGVTWLKFDASNMPAMVSGFAFGPGAGVAVGILTAIIHGLLMADFTGALMNVLTVTCFVLPAAIIYKKKRTYPAAIGGLVLSIIAALAAAIVGNLIVTPMWLGVPFEAVTAMIIPILIPFNLLKGLLNAILTLVIYKSISNLITPKKDQTKGRSTVITFSDVSFTYTGETKVLSELALSIEEGQFVCVLGANGSGKSTFSKLINALLVPDTGTVTVDGLETSNPENTFTIRSTAGAVFQNPDDQIVASLVENDVAFGPENLGIENPELRQRVEESLAKVGLTGSGKRETAALSGGQKQRVAIAGVLAMHPSILIFDEASAMLDPRGRRGLMRVCKELHEQGMTVIMITHFMEEAAEADRVIVLNDGHCVLDGAPDEVLTQDHILRDLNLDVPFATHMSRLLQDRGITIGTHIETTTLKEELCRSLSNR